MGAGATIFGCLGPELSQDEIEFFGRANPWGFILFARNLETPKQIKRLTGALRASVGRDVPILIDQEGGRVARLTAPDWLEWLPPLDQMAHVAPENAARAMWLRYRIIASELRALGIDANCAPMADIPVDGVHPVIRNRCYGQDVGTVVAMAREVANGLLAGGVLPILKHIPGHGRPVADSHLELPHVDAALADLQARDFEAFRQLADLPLGMTAHVVYDAIDPDNCATLSRIVIDVIRRDIGFDGLLMSDDLSMSALSGSLGDLATASLNAGCDLVLHCNGKMDEMSEIAEAAGRLKANAAARAERALAFRAPREPADIPVLLAEYTGLLMVGRDG